MKLIYSLVVILSLSPSLGSANPYSLKCGSELAPRRSIFDRRLWTRHASAFKSAAQDKLSAYPWDFELIWNESVGYLWQEKVTGSYIMVKGDRVAFTSPLDDLQVNQWTEIDFPRTLKKFWFPSRQTQELLNANREELAIWFTRSVYPTILSHDFERAATALKERELTSPEFNHLIQRLALVHGIEEVPAFKLSRHNKLIQFRVRPTLLSENPNDYIIHTHARFRQVLQVGHFLGTLFRTEFTRTRGATEMGQLYRYAGHGFQADAFSIPVHHESYPEDTLRDLLYGLENEGEILFDFYPTTGHFSLNNQSEKGQADRAIWKKYLEFLIRDHGLTPVAEEPNP